MKSTYALALSLAFIGSVLTQSAFAKQPSISDRSVVRSCDVVTPGKLTESELAQLTAKGYRVQKQRSKFKHERVLGVYEYYQLKDGALPAGTLYLNAILAPHPVQRNAIGLDVTFVAQREFRMMVGTGGYQATLHMANSVPSRFSKSAVDLENASFASLPSCHD
jgi:hypothetical protein